MENHERTPGRISGTTRLLGLIADPLARHQCGSLTIVNRTPARAMSLADRLHRVWPALDVQVTQTPAGVFDLAVNATPLGMSAHDELPLSRETIAQSGVVADCVIASGLTPFLEVAHAAGRPIVTGVPMLSSQLPLMLAFMRAL